MFWVNEKTGKEARTEFERISFNGKTSVVKCYPKTGRTHQIRIHLQYLGHPIVNDPLYNNDAVWGTTNGKNGAYEYTKEQLEQNFLKIHSFEAFIVQQERQENFQAEGDDNQNEDKNITADEDNDKVSKVTEANSVEVKNYLIADETSKRKTEDSLKDEVKESSPKRVKIDNEKCELVSETKEETNIKDSVAFDKSRLVPDEDCLDCKHNFRDPTPDELIMYLHALSYKVRILIKP